MNTYLPHNLKVPGCYNLIASAPSLLNDQTRLAILFVLDPSQKLKKIPSLITSEASIASLESPIARQMASAWMNNHHNAKLYVAPLTLKAPQAASFTLNLQNFQSQDQTLRIHLGGQTLLVQNNAQDTPAQLRQKILTAIEQGSDLVRVQKNTLPLEVDSKTSKKQAKSTDQKSDTSLTLTSIDAADFATQLIDTFNITSDAQEIGLDYTLENIQEGAGLPDWVNCFSHFSQTQFHYFVSPSLRKDDLVFFEDELESRYSDKRQIDGRLFGSIHGDLDDLLARSSESNSPHISLLALNGASHPDYLISTLYAAKCADSLIIDPSKPLSRLELPKIVLNHDFDFDARNLLLNSGFATALSDLSGRAFIERAVSTYQFNDQGNEDNRYLDINTSETLSQIRSIRNAAVINYFNGYKLAQSLNEVPSNQKIVTPESFKAFLIEIYDRYFIGEKGWTQSLKAYQASIHVWIDPSDKTLLRFTDAPILVAPFYIASGTSSFA